MSSRDPLSERPTQDRWFLGSLIAACIGIEGLLQLAGFLDLAPPLRDVFYAYGGFWVGFSDQWPPLYFVQPYIMFLTHGFLHGGLLHLSVNMITLWSLGDAVLARVGIGGFIRLYFGAMIGGGICYLLLMEGPALMVGASGALFGLAGGLLTWAVLDIHARKESLRTIWTALAFLVGLNLVLWWLLAGQLAWQAHLGGFVAGVILALPIDRHPRAF